jgi:cellulose synthase/poly-beta-1,6-N-acetylglucosamine synthase-like glycosyltransferase
VRAVLKAVLWTSAGALLYAHAGYPLVLRALAGRQRDGAAAPPAAPPPSVSLIVAAHDEEDVIAAKVANALALDYPRERLEVVVASDGSTDRTVERSRAAGADAVLDLPRRGKIRAQDAAVERSRAEIVAFSDANCAWAPDALRALMRPFADPRVGYVCGQVRFVNEAGSNQEGVYWRYELTVRQLESRLAGVTAGNGAIYATRREAYLVVDPRMGHDLSFPFNLVKRGWRAVYAPDALAEERMVPSLEGEFARKRRMMSHMWPIVVRGGMLAPRGYPPLYAFELLSHRVLRYASPFLHLAALLSALALAGRGRLYALALSAQLALLAAAALEPVAPSRPLRLARYYVLVTASLAAGLVDWLRTGTPAEWERAEGTR